MSYSIFLHYAGKKEQKKSYMYLLSNYLEKESAFNKGMHFYVKSFLDD